MQIEKSERFPCVGGDSLLESTQGITEFEYFIQDSKVIEDIESV